MRSILMDTNVILYPYDIQSPDKATQARRVIDQLELRRSGRLSVQSLAEFIHVATHKLDPPLSRAEALDQASLFARMWPIFDLTALVVLEAARGGRDYNMAYYDAQIWAVARLNQVTTIFSEDFNDGQVVEGVRFVNPFAAGFLLEDWV
jgi:predicted nucleic acid-binding protein